MMIGINHIDCNYSRCRSRHLGFLDEVPRVSTCMQVFYLYFLQCKTLYFVHSNCKQGQKHTHTNKQTYNLHLRNLRQSALVPNFNNQKSTLLAFGTILQSWAPSLLLYYYWRSLLLPTDRDGFLNLLTR